MTLNQKETSLLKDLKEHEQICVEKYSKYAAEANDGQLKGLFTQIGQKEQEHLDTINQIMGGTLPPMQQRGGTQLQLKFTPVYKQVTDLQNKQKDSFFCTDLLSTEKHVSSVYNTAIFEFGDSGIRDALNHIQKEEQQHGEQIYNYMSQNGMYS